MVLFRNEPKIADKLVYILIYIVYQIAISARKDRKVDWNETPMISIRILILMLLR